jgi:hypothetical protein
MFDDDDLDWALGELLELFERANRCGIYPHELAPHVFWPAWALLDTQPFQVRYRWWRTLLGKIDRPLNPLHSRRGKQRYAYVGAH